MKTHRRLIAQGLLGWWFICLVGTCLVAPVYQGLAQAATVPAMNMDAGGHHQGCDSDAPLCDISAFPMAFLVLLAALAPLWFSPAATQSVVTLFRALRASRGWSTGPPVYLLEQRFLE